MFTVRNNYTENEALAFVRECDDALFSRLETVSSEICERKNINIIGLTGPTCSGKTTMAKILIDKLERSGSKVHVISLDDFFHDRATLDARNTTGEIDYDSPDTLDIDLLAKCTREILRGDPVRLPKYDFLTGSRVEGDVIDADDNGKDMFIFEGIQVLYPSVRSLLSLSEAYTSIYISPKSEIYTGGRLFLPNHIRFLRRLVRDYNFRGASADFTMYLWDSVRENEDKFIFPNANSCEYIIDSTLGYDVNMLAPYLKKILSLPHSGRGKIDICEYRSVADEILFEIQNVQEMERAFLTEGSLYREFI